MISLNWTGDYVDIKDENITELTDKITKFGVNIEAVMRNNINNLVVGHVLKVEPHPDSDHLNVCQVNIGDTEKEKFKRTGVYSGSNRSSGIPCPCI